MTDLVNACPRCGALRRVYKCEREHPGRIEPVEMPVMVAERLRELTDDVQRSCCMGGHTVRVYRHAGVQFDGQDKQGAVGFSHEDWHAVARFVAGIE